MSLKFDLYFVVGHGLKAEEYYFKIFDIKSAESLLIAMQCLVSAVYLLLVILLIISDTLLSVKINNCLYPGAEC